MRLALVGGDESDAEKLTCYIHDNVKNIDICRYQNSAEFFGAWEKEKSDIVILNVSHDDKSGIDVARAVRKSDREVRIVFASTSNEFVNESYEVNASYYLRKPYGEDQIEIMLERLDLEKYRSGLAALLGGKEIKFRDIMYVQNTNGTADFFLKDNSVISVKMPLDKTKELFNGRFGFYSLSDNTIINFSCVTICQNGVIEMSDKTELSVPKRKAKEISDIYTAYCFEKLRKGGDI